MARMRRELSACALWLGIYIAAVVLPLFALLPGGATTGRGFVWDFAMAIGYAGLAMLGVQFALTARFRRATAPFGIDLVYYFHRYLALFALLIVLAHYAILRIAYPAVLGTADLREASVQLSAGRCALLLFVVVAAVALLRRMLRLDYYNWRLMHALLSTAGFGLALWHVLGAGHYLDSLWKQALWLGYGAFWLGLIGYVRLVRPAFVMRAPYRVVEVRRERGLIWTLVLTRPSGAALRFSAGQFGWLTLRASPYAMREHPFSIASSAARPERIELSIKELGDFTATIKDVQPGETAWLDAAYGTFCVDRYPDAAGHVFLAGGIGIAPILSMLRTLADRGDRRPLLLFYGNRVVERIAFREELEDLSQRLSLRIVHVLIEPPPDWKDESGFVTREVLERHLAPDRQQLEYFICGPTPMTRKLEHSLAALGIESARVHSEIFDWV